MEDRRTGSCDRTTKETSVKVHMVIDGSGKSRIETGIGFFDHMLDLFACHSLMDLEVICKGDLEVDKHHTVEDVGIAMGQTLRHALGDKSGITRFGSSIVPMDASLVRAVVDLSGRPYFSYKGSDSVEKIGDFDMELVKEFLRSFVDHSMMNLHVDLLKSSNGHHDVEAIFKACARALRQACSRDSRLHGIPSTKGHLD